MPDIFDRYHIPLDGWIQAALDYLVQEHRSTFYAVRAPIGAILDAIETALLAVPPLLFLPLLFLFCWQIAGLRIGIFSAAAMTFLGFVGVWDEAMTTIALVLTSVLFCVVIGIPLGIWAARSDRVAAALRPVLDVMQTMPGFVYMVPVVMLVGIGNVPGIIVTVIFCFAARHQADKPGVAGSPGRCARSSKGIWSHRKAGAVSCPDSAGRTNHHGWRQPDAHDGAFHGRLRFDDRRRGPGANGAARHRPS